MISFYSLLLLCLSLSRGENLRKSLPLETSLLTTKESKPKTTYHSVYTGQVLTDAGVGIAENDQHKVNIHPTLLKPQSAAELIVSEAIATSAAVTNKPTSVPTKSPITVTSGSQYLYPTYAPNSQLEQDGIYYHGGSVMLGQINVYIIWYGDWTGAQGSGSDANTQSIITNFVSNLGGSPWWNILTSYTGPNLARLSNNLVFAKSATVKTTGKISTSILSSVITSTIAANSLPLDSKGIYLVIPSQNIVDSANVNYQGCSSYCGYHTYTTYKNTVVTWALITNPYACPNGNGCMYYSSGTVNGNAAADAMVSVIAHEMAEAATDNLMNAWYSSSGYENGDLCAWNYGTSQNYNVQLGSRKYLIQQLWLNSGSGSCAMGLSSPAVLTPTTSPSAAPTTVPVVYSSSIPTQVPSSAPVSSSGTASPSAVPTTSPSTVPTPVPSPAPSRTPVSASASPTQVPVSSVPTPVPSTAPSTAPVNLQAITTSPSTVPTTAPSLAPAKSFPTYSPNAGLVQAGINYNGGAVMLGKVNVYLIFYGDWSGTQGSGSNPTVMNLITNFASTLGGSGWWNIITTYTQGTGARMSNNLALAGTAMVSGSSSVSQTMLGQLVSSTITSGLLPKDKSGIYLVIPSQNIKDPANTGSSGCTSYCGYHTSVTLTDGTPIVWGFITNPYSCPNYSGCMYYGSGTVNGNAAADAMVSVIAHEIAEAATDPFGYGWWNSGFSKNPGYENGDMCAWNYGTTANSNIILGSNKYLIQQNWLNVGSGSCAMSF